MRPVLEQFFWYYMRNSFIITYMNLTLRAVALSLLAAGALAGLSTLQSVYSSQLAADPTIQGVAVAVFDSTGVIDDLSGAFGYANSTNLSPFLLDTGFPMNTLSEHLIITAALQLVSTGVLSLDSPIPTTYLPGQLSLVNPSYPSISITLRMLMTQTSTLTDVNFASYSTTSPTPCDGLRSFITSYFITTSGGVNVLASSIFSSTATPGTPAAYNFAKINSALITYIVEAVVIANPALVSSGTLTALGYVTQNILAPLGMTETVTLSTTGVFPTLSYPAGGALYPASVAADLSSSGALISTRTLSPAYYSDYMTMSSTLDIATFIRNLFLVSSSAYGSLQAQGTQMLSTQYSISNPPVISMTATGLGVEYFSGTDMCSLALGTGVITSCTWGDSGSVWGFVSSGEFSEVGYYCTTSQSTTNPTCVVTVHTYTDAGTTTKSASLSQAMAAVALQEALVTSSTTTVSSSSTSSLYGVWVFFGVLGVLVFVLAASYFTEYVIQPAPVTGGVPVPQSMMPQQAARMPADTFYGRS